MSTKQVIKRDVKYDTDKAMRKMWFCMLSDFRTSYGENYNLGASKAMHSGIKDFRLYQFPGRSVMKPYFQKVDIQLQNLFKRYRFKDDAYTDSELTDVSLKKFIDTQIRISAPFKEDIYISNVLQRARGICKKILGIYSLDEHRSLCRFGKKAALGLPKSDSYLHNRCRGNITGSPDHIKWFRENLDHDPLLKEIFSRDGVQYVPCDTLNLSYVPKSWKALRGIVPDTIIGGFYTAGLGRYIQQRLLSAGLDIRHTQKKHRVLARLNSVTRKLVTADLTAASDSLTMELLRKVLPLPWYRAIMYGRIPNIKLPTGEIVRMNTVLTMGLGQTFPLQTLVFYSILKAIGELEKRPKTYVSVYGDDLIYPRGMHKQVACVFPKIHLLLNADKTYVNDFFRESCGGDYCHGFDVRPFQPEGSFQLLNRQSYAYFLYKLLNGVRLRWDPVEIPATLDFINTELYLCSGEILQVPPSFPDGSGYKVDTPQEEYLWSCVELTSETPKRKLYPLKGERVPVKYIFPYLREVPGEYVVRDRLPYYWERLRTGDKPEVEESWNPDPAQSILMWKRIRIKRTAPNRGKAKALTSKEISWVSSKTESRLVRQTGSVPNWAWGTSVSEKGQDLSRIFTLLESKIRSTHKIARKKATLYSSATVERS